jgi:hypothetical protein
LQIVEALHGLSVIQVFRVSNPGFRVDGMSRDETSCDDSLYPIAVLIDELRNEDVTVSKKFLMISF